MGIEYVTFQGIPKEDSLAEMLKLHTNIFGESSNLINRMQEKQALYVDLALEHQRVVGFKMGYSLNNEQFYSWLGGVAAGYRKQGIASALMERQHRYLKEQGYAFVRTHTKNKWRSMLLLNIRSGFDVIGTYTDKEGEPKIILEKQL